MLRPVDDRAIGTRGKRNFPDHLPISQVGKEPQLVLNELAAKLAAAVLACDELRRRNDTLSAQLWSDIVAFELVVREAVFRRAMITRCRRTS